MIRFPWDAILMLLLIFFLGGCVVYPNDNLVKLKCIGVDDCKLMTNVLICDDKNLYCEYISLPIHD